MVNGNVGVCQEDFINDELNRKGKFIFANGYKYEGELKDGKFHGKGELIFVNGYKYEGDFEYGKFHGLGKYTYKNGDTYEGEFKDGKRHGKGKFIFPNRNKYQGEFINDEFNRKVEFIFPNGYRDKGLWEQGALVEQQGENQKVNAAEVIPAVNKKFAAAVIPESKVKNYLINKQSNNPSNGI